MDFFKGYKQYILYKKSNKIPLDYRTFKPGSIHTKESWLDYNRAACIADLAGDKYGVGFVFTKQDPFVFIDIDDCITDGVWSPLANRIVAMFPGAAIEISSSGQGLHLFMSGKLPEGHGCRNTELGVELYDNGRFVATTGTAAIGEATIDHTEALERFNQEFFKKSKGSSGTATWTTEPCSTWKGPEDDMELTEFLCSMRAAASVFGNSLTFKQLWEGDEEAISKVYPDSSRPYDASRADASLAQRLAWATGNNCERIERLMRMSKLVRDKWEREDYLPRTILNACGKQQDFLKDYKQLPTIQKSVEAVNNNRGRLEKTHYPQLNAGFTKPVNTSENLKYLLDHLGIKVKYNKMSHNREISIPGHTKVSDDQDNLDLDRIIGLAEYNHLPISRIDENLRLISREDEYHPIVKCLAEKPWDGKERLMRFIATLDTTNNELRDILVRKWMLSAVAAAHSETGFGAQGVLVLEGPQGLGKTDWIKYLDPVGWREGALPTGCGAVKEGALLDPSNKDSVLKLASYWIVELGELEGTFRKADMARLKSYITNTEDEERAAYARKNSKYARRTVYIASVNSDRFLTDDTGNRRWWTLSVKAIEWFEDHKIDMQQVWAEVAHYWKNGESPALSKEQVKLLNGSNEKHENINPYEEKVLKLFDWESSERPERMTCSEVLFHIGYPRPTRSEATHMASVLFRYLGRSQLGPIGAISITSQK